MILRRSGVRLGTTHRAPSRSFWPQLHLRREDGRADRLADWSPVAAAGEADSGVLDGAVRAGWMGAVRQERAGLVRRGGVLVRARDLGLVAVARLSLRPFEGGASGAHGGAGAGLRALTVGASASTL